MKDRCKGPKYSVICIRSDDLGCYASYGTKVHLRLVASLVMVCGVPSKELDNGSRAIPAYQEHAQEDRMDRLEPTQFSVKRASTTVSAPHSTEYGVESIIGLAAEGLITW
jgi:hypothetical protein